MPVHKNPLQGLLKYYWGVLTEIYNLQYIIYQICFQLNRGENGKYNIFQESYHASSKTNRGSKLDLELFNVCEKI